jgi:hypothetical protein
MVNPPFKQGTYGKHLYSGVLGRATRSFNVDYEYGGEYLVVNEGDSLLFLDFRAQDVGWAWGISINAGWFPPALWDAPLSWKAHATLRPRNCSSGVAESATSSGGADSATSSGAPHPSLPAASLEDLLELMLRMEAARSATASDDASPVVASGGLMLPTSGRLMLPTASVSREKPTAVQKVSTIGVEAIVHLVSAAGGEARLKHLGECCIALGIGAPLTDDVYKIIFNLVCDNIPLLFQEFSDESENYMETFVKLRIGGVVADSATCEREWLV